MLHDGSIAEMKTGEGKTLVSTLAAYLNALTGEGVHGMLTILNFLEGGYHLPLNTMTFFSKDFKPYL